MAFLFASGCTNLGPTQRKLDDKMNVLHQEEQASVQAYVTGTVDVLQGVTTNTPETDLALEFSENAQGIVGTPPPGERINTHALLSEDPSVRKLARKELTQREERDAELSAQIKALQTKLDKVEASLVQKGIEKEKEDK